MALCTVSGVLKDGSETAIQSAVVSAVPVTSYFSTTIQIVPKVVSTTSDTNGAWSLSLNQGGQFLVTIMFPPNSTDSARRAVYTITVPATSTANLSALVTEL